MNGILQTKYTISMHSNKQHSYLLIFLIVVTVLQLSCSAPKALEYKDCRNFAVEKVGFANSAVKMELVYFNPNTFSLQLKRTEVEIYIDNVLLGTTTQEYQITIPKKQDFSLPLTIQVDMKNLLRNGMYALVKKEVTVKVKGNVKVGKANAFISFPILYEGKQPINIF